MQRTTQKAGLSVVRDWCDREATQNAGNACLDTPAGICIVSDGLSILREGWNASGDHISVSTDLLPLQQMISELSQVNIEVDRIESYLKQASLENIIR